MELYEKLIDGEVTIGTFLNLGSAVASECAAIAGFDYVIVDLEHSQFGINEAAEAFLRAERRGMSALARVPEISRAWILKLLDAGAKGIIVPGVKNFEEAEKLVAFSKYPPLGNRGFCPTRVSDFGYGNAFENGILAYTEEANRNTLMIPQCETLGCLNDIENIVSLEGIDGIFIGPFDLSLALGKPGDFSNIEFKKAIRKVKDACHEANKPVFIFAPDEKSAKSRIEEGYDSITLSADLNIMTEAMSAISKKLRS